MSLFRAIADLAAPPRRSKAIAPRLLQPFSPGSPMTRDWDPRTAIREGFKAQSMVYGGIMRVAFLGSDLPWIEQRKSQASDKWELVKNSPLVDLLEAPNDRDTRAEFIEAAVIDLMASGNALFLKIQAGGRTKELLVESPIGVNVFPDATGGVAWYEAWDGIGQPRIWAPEDIAHARIRDPENPLWGMSFMKVLSLVIDGDVARQKSDLEEGRSGGVPRGLLIDHTVSDAGTLNEVRAKIKAYWQDPESRTYPWAIAGSSATPPEWVQLALSPADLQTVEKRAFTREEVIIALGFDPAVFTVSAATDNNVKHGQINAWKNAVAPRMNRIAHALTKALLPRNDWGRRRLAFDYSAVQVLREDYGAKATQAVQLRGIGVPLGAINSKLELGFEAAEVKEADFAVLAHNYDRVTPLPQEEVDAEETLADAAVQSPPPTAPSKPEPAATPS